MKHLIILYAILFAGYPQQKPNEIVGTWDSGKANIAIYQSGDKFIGNPLDKQGNRVEELEILNLEYQDGEWVGKLYAKKRDKLMDVVCEVKENKLLLEVGSGFLKKEIEWSRVDAADN